MKEENDGNLEGVNEKVRGWGRKKKNGGVSKVLMWVNVKVIKKDVCDKKYGRKIIISYNICDSGEGGRRN
jgi:hypothetical protein